MGFERYTSTIQRGTLIHRGKSSALCRNYSLGGKGHGLFFFHNRLWEGNCVYFFCVEIIMVLYGPDYVLFLDLQWQCWSFSFPMVARPAKPFLSHSWAKFTSFVSICFIQSTAAKAEPCLRGEACVACLVMTEKHGKLSVSSVSIALLLSAPTDYEV